MRPTLDEFLDSVKNIYRPYQGGYSVAEHYFDNNTEFSQKTRGMTWANRSDFRDLTIRELDVSRHFVWMTHETGGVSGGSCWDSSDPQPYHNSDPMPAFNELYLVLERVVPNITFIQGKVLESTLVKDTDYTDHEYYGNCTEYQIKYISLVDLYNYLVEKEMI